MSDAAGDLCAFIDASPSPFHAVATAAERLDGAGFTRLEEADAWAADAGRGRRYVVRDGALVAWASDDPVDGWRIAGAHTDSPNLRIKPRPDTGRAGARQLAVEPYGGVLLNSWLGRDLGLSGRVGLADGTVALVRVDEPVLHLPQLAIHLDREITTAGLLLNAQQHVVPIWGLGAPDEGGFRQFLAERLGVDPGAVVAWDVMTHDLAPSTRAGRDGELVSAPRLDNLCSAWAAIDGLIRARTGVVALWDHEEIGSDTNRGAGSPLLPTVLERMVGAKREAYHRALAQSTCLSIDMAHATHPNYAEKHEPGHWVTLGGGPVIKTNVNQRYATDARSAAVFAAACTKAGVTPQWYAHRADLPCGSTIGPITAAKLGIPVVDAGAPMLAMHSARELMATADVAPYRDVVQSFLAG
ncbi:MAG TPA: M18 family aminopeptidase [Acidimicrobiales bacterium]|nr:M18 family aminopeptidase [Acidimicrobiales bacterium]